MQTQIGKWGNSLAVRIPRTYVQDLQLKEGMDLEVSFEQGKLVFRPLPKQYTLEELLSQVTPENLHEETDWGPPQGREFW